MHSETTIDKIGLRVQWPIRRNQDVLIAGTSEEDFDPCKFLQFDQLNRKKVSWKSQL